MLHCIALCMLSFACKSWAGKIAFPFSEYTQLYSFKASTGTHYSLPARDDVVSQAVFRFDGMLLNEAPLIHDVNTNAGEEVHSVSEPLPAYLLPQDPYFSVIKKYLQPPLGDSLGPFWRMREI